MQRIEKSIKVNTFTSTREVTKDYYKRAEMKPFGIGSGFDDLKSNASVNTVQSENVWTPYYEVNFIELDFKEKMMQKQAEKALDVGGSEVKELEKQLKEHDERVKAGIQDAKDAAAGKPKKFNIQDKLRELKKKEEVDENTPVIDPKTVKIRGINNEIKEEDLKELLAEFGFIVRARIPMNEDGTNKGIGFVTFSMAESATKAIEYGFMKFDYYELPIERATQSKAQMERQAKFGDRPRGDFGGDRGGRGGGDRGGRGRGGYDREGGERRPREEGYRDGDFLQRRKD